MQSNFQMITMVIAASVFVSSCVAYPKKVEFYDAECEIIVKKLTLEVEPVTQNVCSFEEECLVFLGISAASAVVSGSIVVIGNTIYWLEKVGKCVRTVKILYYEELHLVENHAIN